MRWNEGEVAQLANQTPAWEGKLIYKPPKNKNRGAALTNIFQGGNSDEPRERWFRLRANCLFYFRLMTNGGRPPLGSEPLGVLILENFHVQPEGFDFDEAGSAFSIIFGGDDKKHVFMAESQRHAKQWQNILQGASYQELRDKLVRLQLALRHKTNSDPLRGTAFESNPLFSPGVNIAVQPGFDFPPKPKPRRPKAPKSTFQSHVVENWENHSPVRQMLSNKEEQEHINGNRPTFQSHVPTGNLLDL